MSASVEPSSSWHGPDVLPAVAAEPQRGKSAWREYAEAVLLAVVLSLFLRTFIVQAFKIPSGSMLPTLQVGDHILVNKLAYGFRLPFLAAPLWASGMPQRGDIVVFTYPLDASKDFIKRVVGVAGDVIEIRNKHLYINGELWNDLHAYFADGRTTGGGGPRDIYGPVTVPDGQVFVMGDNRDRSYDSRFWGFVDLHDVRGKAFLIYWSWDGHDRGVRWERTGELIE